MFRPTPRVLAALEELSAALDDGHPELARRLRAGVADALGARRPDLSGVLLLAARNAGATGLELGRELTAAAVRAGCAALGEAHPGATIEVRVPPFAAVQIGFEGGSRHTRGTPPNVVEMAPDAFLALAVGALTWDQAAPQVRASGVHAAEAARAFPI